VHDAAHVLVARHVERLQRDERVRRETRHRLEPARGCIYPAPLRGEAFASAARSDFVRILGGV
jgi:hypothetical protein